MEHAYRKLALAVSINTVMMFFLTFVMISEVSHFHVNINRIYMALLMAAPMVSIMLLLMPSMFRNRRLNALLNSAIGAVFIVLLILTRTQTPVGNGQFLRSMIPHHSSAILMCERASLTDPVILALCDQIVQAQKAEIRQMEAILGRDRPEGRTP